jgi:hypothetical protein
MKIYNSCVMLRYVPPQLLGFAGAEDADPAAIGTLTEFSPTATIPTRAAAHSRRSSETLVWAGPAYPNPAR